MLMLRLLLLSAFAALFSSAAFASQGASDSSVQEYQLTFNSAYSSPFMSDWIPIKRQNTGHIIFDAYVEGTKVRALLDTGASHSIIDLALAQKLGLRQTGSMNLKDINAVATKSPMFSDSTIVAGGRSIIGLPIWGLDLSPLRSSGIDADFILGMDVMKHGGLMLDMSKERIRFLPEGTKLNNADMEVSLQLSDDGQKTGVSLPISGETNLSLFLDTGMDSALLLPEQLFRKLVPDRPRTTISKGGFASSSVDTIFFAPQLPLGKIDISNAVVVKGSADQFTNFAPFEGFLGMAVVSQFDSVFDFKSAKWFFAKRKNLVVPDRRTLIGIQTGPDDKALRVAYVMTGSPAEKAGFKIGDRICKTDGQDALTEFFQRQMMPYDKGPIGKKKTYELCDGGILELVTAEFY